MMNRADYETLAASIKEADVPEEHKQTLVLEIASGLCASNDRFDPVRFVEMVDVDLAREDVANYSHALRLRATQGVGRAREELRTHR